MSALREREGVSPSSDMSPDRLLECEIDQGIYIENPKKYRMSYVHRPKLVASAGMSGCTWLRQSRRGLAFFARKFLHPQLFTLLIFHGRFYVKFLMPPRSR